MAQWPVHLVPKSYRGSNPAKLRRWQEDLRLCQQISAWINAQGETQTVRWKMYTYADVAFGVGISHETASRLCHQLDAGGNGFFLIREGLPDPRV